eukprot:3479339-Rhodomonas_salina.3
MRSRYAAADRSWWYQVDHKEFRLLPRTVVRVGLKKMGERERKRGIRAEKEGKEKKMKGLGRVTGKRKGEEGELSGVANRRMQKERERKDEAE